MKKILDKIYSSVLRYKKRIHPTAKVEYGAKIARSTYVDAYTFVGAGARIDKNTLNIGRFCSISSGALIGPNNHPIAETSTSAVFYSSSWGIVSEGDDARYKFNKDHKTIIGSDVWVGAKAIILGGVNIGHGSVIGAGAVVTKDVEPYTIVAGVPAKHIKYRFPPDTIEMLLKSRWWEFAGNKVDNEWLESISLLVKNK